MENTNDKEKFELPTLWAYLKSDPSALLRILFPNSNGEFICCLLYTSDAADE